MKNILSVGLGGAIGSLLRYSLYTMNLLTYFPYGTLIVNLAGSLLLGLLTGWFSSKENREWVRLGLGVGLCGGFTTMSTFSAEVITLITEHSTFSALLYVLVSLLGGLLFAGIGLSTGSYIKKWRVKEG